MVSAQVNLMLKVMGFGSYSTGPGPETFYYMQESSGPKFNKDQHITTPVFNSFCHYCPLKARKYHTKLGLVPMTNGDLLSWSNGFQSPSSNNFEETTKVVMQCMNKPHISFKMLQLFYIPVNTFISFISEITSNSG